MMPKREGFEWQQHSMQDSSSEDEGQPASCAQNFNPDGRPASRDSFLPHPMFGSSLSDSHVTASTSNMVNVPGMTSFSFKQAERQIAFQQSSRGRMLSQGSGFRLPQLPFGMGDDSIMQNTTPAIAAAMGMSDKLPPPRSLLVQSMESQSSLKKKESSSVRELDLNLPFPVKLHYILSHPEYSEYISWLPHGRAWRIMKPKSFEEKVIPKFFRSDKYASFMRQVRV